MFRSLFFVFFTVVLISGCGAFRRSPEQERYEARLEEGRSLARRSMMVEAAAAFEDATYADPDGAEAHFLLARTLVDIGQTYRAVDELRIAERLRPDHGPQRALLGEVLTRLGRLDEAEEVLVRTVEQWPDAARAHLALGRLRTNQGELAQAEIHLTKAVRLDATLPGVHEATGRVLLRLGRADQAVTRFQDAARQAPEDDLAHGGLGAALVVVGRPAEAQAAFLEAIHRCGNEKTIPAWHAGLAASYGADARWTLAKESLTASGAFFRAPVAAALSERLDQAAAGWVDAGCSAHEMVCSQSNGRLWAGALLLLILGAADGAARELQTSIDLYDGDSMSRWLLAETLVELHREEEAILELERATAWAPSAALAAAIEDLRNRIQGADQPE